MTAAPLLLTGARLVTEPEPVDVLVAEGRVLEIAPVGRLAGGPGAAAVGVERVDLAGRWLVPGLWDAHVHAVQQALAARRLDVSIAGSASEAADLVATRARSTIATTPDGDRAVLVGFGFRDAAWPDLPTRALLDAAAPGRAVVLVSGDLHCGWFSSAALAHFGLASDSSGLVAEDDFLPIAGSLDDADDDVRDSWVRQTARDAARRGVVGVSDYEADHPLAWVRRTGGESRPSLRVRVGVWPQFLDEVIELGLRTGVALPGSPLDATGAPLLTVGSLKVITDGSLNTRSAYCYEPYPDTDDHGVLAYPPAELGALMARAHAAGIRSAIHAIGDHAGELALDAFESIGARGSIEHAQLLALRDVGRFARLGVTASVQPAHLLDDRDVAEQIWPGRTDRAFLFASLAAAGADLALGSDAPVAPLDPWVAIGAAVRRTGDERPAWYPEQRIGAEVALAASTDGQGTAPRAGAVADLAIVEIDPLAADPRTSVTGTLIAGEWTHREGL